MCAVVTTTTTTTTTSDTTTQPQILKNVLSRSVIRRQSFILLLSRLIPITTSTTIATTITTATTNIPTNQPTNQDHHLYFQGDKWENTEQKQEILSKRGQKKRLSKELSKYFSLLLFSFKLLINFIWITSWIKTFLKFIEIFFNIEPFTSQSISDKNRIWKDSVF